MISSRPSVPRPPSVGLGNIDQINQSSYKRFIWYFLIVSLICALPVFILYKGHDNVQFKFIIFQAIVLIIASFHIYFVNEKLVWDDDMIFVKKFIFTLGIMLCGGLFFWLLCKYLVLSTSQDYADVYVTYISVFIIPFFVIATFDKAMLIPALKYKLWFYSDNIKPPDLDLIDFSNSYIMSFEFPKKYNDTTISNFKFKAPLDMQFGELFYMYITEYNDKNRENPIEYQDLMSKSYGWLFYIKANAWWKSKEIFDPHLTIRQNKIKETDIIAPKRFIVE